MRSAYVSLIISLLLCTFTFSQNPFLTDTIATQKEITTDSEKSKTKDETQDTTKEVKKADTSKSPVNHFVSGDEDTSTKEEVQTDVSEPPVNPFVSGGETVSPTESFEETEERGIDILLDFGFGVGLSRFFIEPKDISTEGKPRFLFNPGIMIPFGKRFYASIAIRYMQLAVGLSNSTKSIGSLFPTTYDIDTKELMTFLSAPIKIGMRFELAKITPYFYANAEPAYLLSGNQLVFEEVTTVYPDSSIYYSGPDKPDDIETTDYRERSQAFVGAGIGIEFSYGYGYVYIDGCCQYGLKDTDISNPPDSKPLRIKSNAIYFPISMGIRFFL